MTKSTIFHRIWSYIRHSFKAWNTTGEGIHSPYLFHIVRFIIRDGNAYYCFADIERQRERLQRCTDMLDVVDFGSAGSPEGTHIQRRVCDIASSHLERPEVGQLLFRLTNFLVQHEKRPLEILELGTSLGITTAYLASSDSHNRVTTYEGSDTVLQVAQEVWRMLKLENILWQHGNIDNTLFICARERIDIAYVDANHTYEATKRYADFLLPKITENGMLILDDIHHSEEMERAWKELQADPRVTTSMDLYHLGILFVNPCFLKRNYRIKLRNT